MEEKQIIERIRSLCRVRMWSSYRLAKESGIPYSTLCTMLNKANAPSISTLMKICQGFGITLSDFFDDGSEEIYLSDTEKEHMRQWCRLNSENQSMVKKYIEYLLSDQDHQT